MRRDKTYNFAWAMIFV